MEASICHFWVKICFVQFDTFVSRVKLRVFEKCSICQITECPAMVITHKIQVKSELLFLCTGQKRLVRFFYDTWNYLKVTIQSSELSSFVLYPKTITSNFTFVYGTMLGSKNSELSSFALHAY